MTIIRVVDFETTGVEPPAEVCEVGFCDLHLEERKIDPPNWRLYGVQSMPPEVRAIHHISFEECRGLEPFNPEWMSSSDVSAFAAHNAAFEVKFFTPTIPVICTYKAALRVWPTAPAHNNGTLRYWLQDKGG